jgi:hypothetical protein
MAWLSVEPGDVNHFVTGGEVVAVEVYQDVNVPAQYMRGGGSCTTIVGPGSRFVAETPAGQDAGG